MFKNIPYFNLQNIYSISDTAVYAIGEKLNLLTSITNDEHLYFCFTPKEFEYYSLWIYENIHYNDYEYYSNDDEYDEHYVLNKALTPLMILKDNFIFLKAKKKDTNYYIEEIYDTKEVFEYWINHNHFTNLEQWENIGIGKSIFNLLPENHNYYDRNLICTCGRAECNNLEVWYIKYTASYAIPFIIDLNKRLVFDLHYFDKENKWQDEDYLETSYSEKENYRTFPFLFHANDFKLMKQSLFANE
ncbi:MAG: hypothetical protein U0U67_15080 [Chitinophagales bacterium]